MTYHVDDWVVVRRGRRKHRRDRRDDFWDRGDDSWDRRQGGRPFRKDRAPPVVHGVDRLSSPFLTLTLTAGAVSRTLGAVSRTPGAVTRIGGLRWCR